MQKKARLELTVNATQAAAGTDPQPAQHPTHRMGTNGSNNLQKVETELAADSNSLASPNHGQTAAESSLPAATDNSAVRNQAAKSNPTVNIAPADTNPGPFGGKNKYRGIAIFGSKGSHQRPSAANVAPAAAAEQGLRNFQPTSSETAQQPTTAEEEVGFGKPQIQAFGSARRVPPNKQEKEAQKVKLGVMDILLKCSEPSSLASKVKALSS